MILQSRTYHFHRLDLTRQGGFIVTIYDEDGLRLAAPPPLPTPDGAFTAARKIVTTRSRGRENNRQRGGASGSLFSCVPAFFAGK